MSVTTQACELLPHFFTLACRSKWLFSVTLSVTEEFLPQHPLFLEVHYSMLPGLSSPHLRWTAISHFALQMYSFLNAFGYSGLFTGYEHSAGSQWEAFILPCLNHPAFRFYFCRFRYVFNSFVIY